MLKNKSFFVAERGGDDVLESCPLEAERGGDDMAWSFPHDRLSALGEELTVLEVWPEKWEAESNIGQALVQCSKNTKYKTIIKGGRFGKYDK